MKEKLRSMRKPWKRKREKLYLGAASESEQENPPAGDMCGKFWP